MKKIQKLNKFPKFYKQNLKMANYEQIITACHLA